MRTIAVAATSNWVEDDLLAAGLAVLKSAGLAVVLAPQLTTRYGDLAGPDADRAAAFQSLWGQGDVAAIVVAAGGYGAGRLLPRLDWSLDNPTQTWLGFSDVTALLNARVAQRGGWGWHGPLLKFFGPNVGREDTLAALNILSGKPPLGYDPPQTRPAKAVQPGKAKGRLLGGNLAVFRSLLGTPYAPKPQPGDILFFEEIGEKNHSVDRDLEQLAQAGYFETASGVLFGRFSDLKIHEPKPFAFSTEEILMRKLRESGFSGPVVMDFPAGHGQGLNLPLPVGREVELEAGNSVALAWK